MRKSVTAVMAITLMCVAASLACAQGSSSAMDVLASVGTTYGSMSTFQGEGTAKTVMDGPGMQVNTESPIVLALEAPNKMRMETDAATIKTVEVFDGHTEWMYFPVLNEYSEFSVPPAASAEKSGMNEYNLFSEYGDIAKQVQQAHILRSETVTLNGAPADCWVIEADYKNVQPGQAASGLAGANAFKALSAQAILWVTKDQDWVAKYTMVARVEMSQSAKPTEMTITYGFDKITVNQPLADSVFVFTPPAGAREMSSPQSGLAAKSPAH